MPPPRRGMRHPQFNTLDEDDFESLCDDPSQPSARWLAAVLEATWAYCSRASDDLAICMRELAECLDEIVRTWPGALVPALNLLDGITRGTPVGAVGPIWDLVAGYRRRSGRIGA